MAVIFNNAFILVQIRNWYTKYQENEFLKRFTGVLGIDILVKGSAFLLIPLYLRLMSQEDFGLYNYLITIITTFSIILNLGLYVAQSKVYHEYNTNDKKGIVLYSIYLGLLFFLVLFFGLVIVFKGDYLFIRLLFEKPIDYSKYRVIVLFSVFTSVLSFMLTNYFYTTEKIRQVKIFNIYRIVIINIASIVLLYFAHVDSVKVRLSCVYATEFLLSLTFSRYIFNEFVAQFDWSVLKKSFAIGLPISISAIFSFIINLSDKFFLEQYGTRADLSNYYLAFTFASILSIIFTSFQNVWLPTFLKEKNLQKSFKNTRNLVSKLFPFITICCFIIWIVFILLFFVNIIPIKYKEVIYILPFLLVTQTIAILTTIYGNYLVFFEKTYLAAIAGFIVSVVSIGLCSLLVPKWGIYGAALSTLVATIFYLVLYYRWANKFRLKYA